MDGAGELNAIFSHIQKLEQNKGEKVGWGGAMKIEGRTAEQRKRTEGREEG